MCKILIIFCFFIINNIYLKKINKKQKRGKSYERAWRQSQLILYDTKLQIRRIAFFFNLRSTTCRIQTNEKEKKASI